MLLGRSLLSVSINTYNDHRIYNKYLNRNEYCPLSLLTWDGDSTKRRKFQLCIGILMQMILSENVNVIAFKFSYSLIFSQVMLVGQN